MKVHCGKPCQILYFQKRFISKCFFYLFPIIQIHTQFVQKWCRSCIILHPPFEQTKYGFVLLDINKKHLDINRFRKYKIERFGLNRPLQ